ncbi:30S ribosomal protein S6e [archaeon]|nr:30S ribosomal protein S6e [archaeon]
MEFKLTINDGAKSYKHVIKEPEANALIGLKIGETIEGSKIGFNGYEFIISGGSDASGFPMKKGITSGERSKMLKKLPDGRTLRQTVRGNTISESTSQVNLKVKKKGKKKLEDFFKIPTEKKEE